MNKEQAIHEIWNALYDSTTDQQIEELVRKYCAHKLYVLPMDDFDSFCKKHFPGQFFTVSWAIFEAAHMDRFHDSDEWVSWNEEKQEFRSADEAIVLIGGRCIFREIIEKAIRNHDPLLDTLDVDDAIKIIKEDLKYY